MRFKITFNRTGKQRMLPMDYQYYLSAWIYKVIGQADPLFSDFLHSQGYVNGHRSFKLFGYSPLSFGKPVLWKEKSLFEIQENQLSVNISFHLAEAAERFIIGLFNNQKLYLGDRFNGNRLIGCQCRKITGGRCRGNCGISRLVARCGEHTARRQKISRLPESRA